VKYTIVNLIQFFYKRSKSFYFIAGILLLVVVGFVDYATGLEVSVSLFYLLPVAIFSWFLGKTWGISISIASAMIWFSADLLISPTYSHPLIPYWNATVLFGFLLIVSYILTTLKSTSQYEQELAREVQQGLLPKAISPISGFDISGKCQPSEAVGGDYFDVLKFDESYAGFCIADAIGHGIPAAILISNLQAAVKIYSSNWISPNELCVKINRHICNNIAPDKFITFFYGMIDGKNKKLTYVNAGHNAPILIRKGDAILRLNRESGAALGINNAWHYQQAEIQLFSGDKILLFTDGVVETTNLKGEEFGEARLIQLLKENRYLSVHDLQNRIIETVLKFNHGFFQDDITLLVISVE